MTIEKGLIRGGETTSHQSGNHIPVIVEETGERFNYEGDEYHICAAAVKNDEIFEFHQKTNREVLDFIYSKFPCNVEEGVLNVGDFIICKLVVRDDARYNRTGTVREILNMMQSEKNCRISHKTNTMENESNEKVTIKEIVKESPNIFIARPGGMETSTSTSSSAEVESKDEGELSAGDREIMERYPVLSKSKLIDIEQQTIKILTDNPAIITPEQKYTLEQFEGIGGQHTKGDVNSLYQFYTPYIWVKKMWELAHKHGVPTSGIKVLEPAMGTGRFFKFAPEGAELVGYDPDKTNFDIVKKLYPEVKALPLEFETNFMKESPFDPGIYTGLLSKDLKKMNNKDFDLVIGNPPYGNFTGTYASYFPNFLTRFEILFLYLGIKSLKPEGILVYIISQNFLNNNITYNTAKQEILKLANFVDAYRLPNDIFSTTSVGTDIIVFKRKI